MRCSGGIHNKTKIKVRRPGKQNLNELRAEVIESMQAHTASMASSAATSAQPAVKRNATDDHQVSQGKRSRYCPVRRRQPQH